MRVVQFVRIVRVCLCVPKNNKTVICGYGKSNQVSAEGCFLPSLLQCSLRGVVRLLLRVLHTPAGFLKSAPSTHASYYDERGGRDQDCRAQVPGTPGVLRGGGLVLHNEHEHPLGAAPGHEPRHQLRRRPQQPHGDDDLRRQLESARRLVQPLQR